jgi:hypothetical protein
LKTLSTATLPINQAQGQGIHEYQLKRENMLEFKNFRMVNVIFRMVNLVNVGSLRSQSLESLKSLRGFNVSSSL